MTELFQGFEDLFAIVLYRLLLAFLLTLALARRNFFFDFSRLFFPQIVQYGDFQFRHESSRRWAGNCRRISGMNEFSSQQKIHCECCCVDRELREVLRLAPDVDAEAKLLDTVANGFHEPLDDRTLHAAPIGDFVDDRLAMLMEHLHGWPNAVTSLGRGIEYVLE